MKQTKKLVQECDKLYSVAICSRDNFTCVTCGHRGRRGTGVRDVGVSHVISRRFKATRFDPLNGFCQCNPCNILHSQSKDANERSQLEDLAREVHGDEAYDLMKARSRELVKWKVEDLQRIKEFLLSILSDQLKLKKAAPFAKKGQP